MSIQQPQSTNNTMEIDHALMHRQVGCDSLAPAMAVTINQNGTFSANYGNIDGVRLLETSDSVLSTDRILYCNSILPITVTLPATTVGQCFDIKNIGAGLVTVEGDGSDTIDDELTQELAQGESMTLICATANYWIII